MKIHRPIAQRVPQAITDVFESNYYADKTVEYHLRQNKKKWGGRDRKFFAEAVYDIVRWWRKLKHVVGPKHEVNPWALFEAWLIVKGHEVPGFEEFVGLDSNKILQEYESQEDLGIKHSYPDWMVELLLAELGKESTPLLLEAMNRPAPLYLRANLLKFSVDQVLAQLEQDEIPVELFDEALGTLVLPERKNVFITQAFKQGMFEVQDYGSQQIASLLSPRPGERVLDACAGAGGKTLHLAQMMKNKGKVIATDIHEWKLKELKIRAARNRLDIIETHVIDNKWVKRQKGKFDALLLDVPCSGIGVIKRNPDSKWKLSMERIVELQALQAEILASYSRTVKPGGRMVYATCSVLPSENEKQVTRFLESNSDWKLCEQKTLYPHESPTDGFYSALLARK